MSEWCEQGPGSLGLIKGRTIGRAALGWSPQNGLQRGVGWRRQLGTPHVSRAAGTSAGYTLKGMHWLMCQAFHNSNKHITSSARPSSWRMWGSALLRAAEACSRYGGGKRLGQLGFGPAANRHSRIPNCAVSRTSM